MRLEVRVHVTIATMSPWRTDSPGGGKRVLPLKKTRPGQACAIDNETTARTWLVRGRFRRRGESSKRCTGMIPHDSPCETTGP